MATLGKLLVQLGVDSTELDSGLAGAAKRVEGFGSGLAQAGDKMADVGKKASLGLTLPLVALGKTAFDAASDLNESMSKSKVVFEEHDAVIQQWAKHAAVNLGMSRQQALEAAGTFGNLGKAMGLSTTEASKISVGVVNLAADLASFNNANPEEVLEALRSGLVGETEPLRRFGVSLSAARVEAEALAMGLVEPVQNMAKIESANIGVRKSVENLAKVEAEFGKESQEAADARNKVALAEQTLAKAMEGSKVELTAAQKAQATYRLIMQDTALAHGDFERTADGAANKQRTLAAQFKDTAATVGQQLLPVGQQLLGLVQGWLEKFNSLTPAQQQTILKFAAIAAAVGPVLLVAGKLVQGLGMVVKSVGLAIKIFNALRLVMLANPWILLAAAAVALAIVIVKNWDTIKAAVGAAWDWLKGVGASMYDWFLGVGDWLMALPGKIGDAIVAGIGKLGQFVADLPGLVGKLLGNVIATFIEFEIAVMRFWITLPGKIVGWLWDNAPAIWEFFTGLPGRIAGLLGDAHTWLLHVGKNIVVGIANGIVEWVPRLWEFFTGLPGRIWNMVSGAHEWLVHVGKNVVIGFWNGLIAMGSWIKGKILDFFAGLLGPIADALGLGSPSRITAQYGRWVVQGMAIGMLAEESKLVGVANRIGKSALPSLPFVARPSDPSAGGGAMPAGVSASIGGGHGDLVLVVDGKELGRAALPGTREGLKKVELRNGNIGVRGS